MYPWRKRISHICTHTFKADADAKEECDIRGERAFTRVRECGNLEVCQFVRHPNNRRERTLLHRSSLTLYLLRVHRQNCIIKSPRNTNCINRSALGKHGYREFGNRKQLELFDAAIKDKQFLRTYIFQSFL